MSATRCAAFEFGVPPLVDPADPSLGYVSDPDPFDLLDTSPCPLTFGTSITDPASTFKVGAVTIPMAAANEYADACDDLASLSAAILAGTVDPDGDGITALNKTRTVSWSGGSIVLELTTGAEHAIKHGATAYPVPKTVNLAAGLRDPARVPQQS